LISALHCLQNDETFEFHYRQGICAAGEQTIFSQIGLFFVEFLGIIQCEEKDTVMIPNAYSTSMAVK
jgi:hypothetical protein